MLKTLFNLFRKTDKNSLETLQQRVEQGDAEAMYQAVFIILEIW